METKTQSQSPAVVAQNPILALLKKYEKSIAALVPKHLTGEKMLKLVVNAMNREPKLLQCNPMTLINAVLTAAQLGLEIGPGSAYLLPFRTKKKNAKAPYDCTLVIDYRGKISLALRSGKVLDVDPEIVYSKEKFKIYRGPDGVKRIEHEPMVFKIGPNDEHLPVEENDRGIPIGAYVVTSLRDGNPKITFMSRIDILKIKAKSPASNDGPWVTKASDSNIGAVGNDELEMWKKTVVHRAFKTMPSSADDFDAMRRAQDIDDRVDIGATLDHVIDYEPEDEDAPPIVKSELEEKIARQGEQAEAISGMATDTPVGQSFMPPWPNKSTMRTAFDMLFAQLDNPKEFWRVMGGHSIGSLDLIALNGKEEKAAFAELQALIAEATPVADERKTSDDAQDGFTFGKRRE